MLAFQSMITQGKDIKTDTATLRIVQLAQLMNEFCDTQLSRTFPAETIKLVDDKWASQVDAAINNHIDELSREETTRLPEDREALIQFYDRLQQRKMRREQWLFYAKATESQLADKVLQYLDEEIAERQKAQ
ncbi:MAG: hypothetical protein KGI97_03210 [Alphaproteobacteria bacterium]|nr:hypothetical protein [Alphaproteobacteria bacterium]